MGSGCGWPCEAHLLSPSTLKNSAHILPDGPSPPFPHLTSVLVGFNPQDLSPDSWTYASCWEFGMLLLLLSVSESSWNTHRTIVCQTLRYLVQFLLHRQRNELKVKESPAKAHTGMGWSLGVNRHSPALISRTFSTPSYSHIYMGKRRNIPQTLPTPLCPLSSPALPSPVRVRLACPSVCWQLSWVSEQTCLKLTQNPLPPQTCSSHRLPHFRNWRVWSSSCSRQTTRSPPRSPSHATFYSSAHRQLHFLSRISSLLTTRTVTPKS